MEVDIAIIIPALNEEHYLGYTLQRINAVMPWQYSYVVIVGNHDSVDGTQSIADEFGVCVIDCRECRNVASVRNKCAMSADSKYFLFIDADITLTHKWAENLDEAIRRAEGGAIVGSRPKVLGGSLIEAAWFDCLMLHYVGAAHMLMRSNVFFGLAMMDDSKDTGEDVAFCRLAEFSGHPIDNLPSFEVCHRRYPKTVKDFFRRELWHGIGDWKGVIPQSTVAAVSTLFSLLLILTPFFPPAGLSAIGILIWVTLYKFPEFGSINFYAARLWLTMLYMIARFGSVFLQRRHKRTFQW